MSTLPVTLAPGYAIADMRADDIPAVVVIDAASFPTPWSPAAYAEELARPQATLAVVRRLTDGRAVAYCDVWVAADEMQVLTLACCPTERRHGHARALLGHLVNAAGARGVVRVTLEVRRSNGAAIALYRALGFRSVGVRPGYYQPDQEDALLMNLELG